MGSSGDDQYRIFFNCFFFIGFVLFLVLTLIGHAMGLQQFLFSYSFCEISLLKVCLLLLLLKLIHFLWCTEWPFRCLDIGKAPKNMHLTPALLACRSDDVLAEKRHRAAHTLEEATVATPTQGFTNILLQFRTFKSHLQDHPGSYILLLFTHQNRPNRIQSFLFYRNCKTW